MIIPVTDEHSIYHSVSVTGRHFYQLISLVNTVIFIYYHIHNNYKL